MKTTHNNQTVQLMKNLSILIIWPLLLAGLFASPSPATAQSYWDPGLTDSGTGGGGTGTWGTNTLANWYNGSADVAWTSGSIAYFETSPGTVTLTNNQTANGLTFTVSGYTLSTNSGTRATLTLAGTPTITVPSGGTETIGCIIATTANAPLTESGSGTLILTAVNADTNAITISAGSTLTIGGAGSWPSANAITNNGSLIYSSSAGVFSSGVISGTGTVTENGPGLLTVSAGNKTYKGGTIINSGGEISFGGEGSVGGGANLGFVPSSFVSNNIVLGGGTLFCNNGSVTLNANRGIQLTANSTITEGITGALNVGGAISQLGGSFGLTINSTAGAVSTSIVKLSGVNTYTGPTTISTGMVWGLAFDSIPANATVNGGILVGVVSGSIAGNVTVNTGGALTLSNNTAMSSSAYLTLPASPSAGQVNLNFTGTQNISLLYIGSSPQIAGTYGAPGSGATYTSTTFVGTGILNVSDLGQAYWDPANTAPTASGGTGSWDNSSTVWDINNVDALWPSGGAFANFGTSAGTVTLNASVSAAGLGFTIAGYTISEGGSYTLTLIDSAVISVPSGTTTINCPLGGSTGFSETGSGTLSLGGVETYTGATAIGVGSTLTIAGSGDLGSGTYADNIVNNGYFTYNNSSVAQTLSGTISGSGSTTIGSGCTLTIGGAGVFSNTGNITNSGSFNYSSSASNSTISGIVSGSGTVTENGPGILTFTGGHNTYTGGTTINGGEISIGGDGASGGAPANLGTVPATFTANNIVLNGGTLYANNAVPLNANRGIQLTANSGLTAANNGSNGFPMNIGGAISQSGGSFGLTINSATGAGAYSTIALFGTNTYTGPTTISAGALLLSGGGTIASTNIIVANGATFNVSGLASTFALASGQTLSNSSPTAILNGSAGSGSGTLSLTYAAGTPSFVVTNGTLTLSAGTVFNVNNTGSALAPDSYLIISTNGAAASVAGTAPSVTVSGGGVTAGATSSLSISNNELFLVVAAAAQPPVIGNSVTNTVTSGSMWQIAISSLSNSAAWSDPNSETVTLSSVGPTSANGTNVTSDANNIYYNGVVTAPDNFSYIVTDGTLTATGMVYLVVTPAVSSIISGPAVNGSGNPTFSGIGASVNCVYGVESTTSLSGSPVWIEAGTTTTGPTGSWSFTDINKTNPPTIFYRLYNPDTPGSPPQ